MQLGHGLRCSIVLAVALATMDAPMALAAVPSPREDHASTPPGYLGSGATLDITRVLGPPPADGSGTKAGDVATFMATRRLQGTPRWELATRDAVFGVDPMMADFSCAIGRSLRARSAPKLAYLLSRALSDVETLQKQAKNTWKRPRPFIEQEGAICVPSEPWLQKSYSYPSGHSAFSWTVALILSQIAPDKATDILSRARSYGESRIVCGVHYQSDVQAGRIVGSALYDQLQDNHAFNHDLKRARREWVALGASSANSIDQQSCSIETQASSEPIW